MSKIDIAETIAYGLMAHSPQDPFRQGYTIGNALIAVAERYELTIVETAIVAERLVQPLLDAAKEVYDPDPMDLGGIGSMIPLGDALERFGVPPLHR